MFWFHECSFFKEDEFSEADDDAYYRDDDLDLDFERFHIRHGNREIGSSATEESDDDDEFGDEEGLVHSRSSALLISRVFTIFLKKLSQEYSNILIYTSFLFT